MEVSMFRADVFLAFPLFGCHLIYRIHTECKRLFQSLEKAQEMILFEPVKAFHFKISRAALFRRKLFQIKRPLGVLTPTEML